MVREVLAEFFETIHFKRQMRQIRLYPHRAAAGETGDSICSPPPGAWRKTRSEPRGDCAT